MNGITLKQVGPELSSSDTEIDFPDPGRSPHFELWDINLDALDHQQNASDEEATHAFSLIDTVHGEDLGHHMENHWARLQEDCSFRGHRVLAIKRMWDGAWALVEEGQNSGPYNDIRTNYMSLEFFEDLKSALRDRSEKDQKKSACEADADRIMLYARIRHDRMGHCTAYANPGIAGFSDMPVCEVKSETGFRDAMSALRNCILAELEKRGKDHE